MAFSLYGSTVAFFIVLDSFIFLVVAYDLWTRRSLHRATIWRVVLTASWQLTYPYLAHSRFIDHIVAWLEKG
ncbi:MAG: hypothetical protein WA715_06435 [Candidatus Acidiferrum sp.]